jgi:hypothetical protein
MYDWRKYQKQNVRAVDECANSILSCLLHNKPLKAIHLWPSWYAEFLRWFEKISKQQYEHGVKLQFDSIEIHLGERSQAKPLLLELWQDDTMPIKEQIIQKKIDGLKKYGRKAAKGFEPIMKMVTKAP